MLNLLRSEIFRLRKRSQSWMCLVIGMLLVGLFYGAFGIAYFAVSEADKPEIVDGFRLENIDENGMSIALLFVSILITIVGAGLIGSEYSWNTIRPLLARATSRPALLTAKWITLLLYTALCMFLVAVVAPFVYSVVGMWIIGESQDFSGEVIRNIIDSSARGFLVMIPTAALAFTLALVTRSLAVGIAVAIGLGFLEPAIFGILGLLHDSFDTIQKYGMSWPGGQLMTYGFDASVSTSDLRFSIIVLAVYTIIFVNISYIVFKRRDVTSG